MALSVRKKECGICGESRAIFHHNLLTVKTKFSSTTVVQLLERFFDRELSDRTTDLEQSGTCKDCYAKLNDYDAAYTKALIIQQELTDLLQNSTLRLLEEVQIQSESEEEEKVDEKHDEIKWEQSEELEESDGSVDTKLATATLSVEAVSTIHICMECDVCGESFTNMRDVQLHTHDEVSEDEQLEVAIKKSPNTSPMLVIETIEKEHPSGGVVPKDCDDHSESMYTEYGIVQPYCKMEIKEESDNTDEIQHPFQKMAYRLECLYCEATFEDKANLRGHLKVSHPIDGHNKCKVCGFLTKTRAALASHYGKHVRESKLSCSVCSKKFTQKASLKRHMAIHTGEKAYQCDQCGKQYIHYSSFYMHQLAHRDVRAKKCTICGYSLPSNSHLKRHMRTHSGEKPYDCPVCGQKFSQRYNMVQHLNAHNGKAARSVKTINCPHCPHASDRNSQLKKHVEKYHPDKAASTLECMQKAKLKQKEEGKT
uniref:C2H2-type domain-containing protein n=1 Tax=Anopheles christyi TaxID=43041 RepID=A0A182JT62_9DIPT